jgi:hypothetical protein
MFRSTTGRFRRSHLLPFLLNLIFVFLPLPIPGLRRRLSGFEHPDGTIEFFGRRDDTLCFAHLIWVGWCVAIGGWYNQAIAGVVSGWPAIPERWLNAPWVLTLIVTLLVLALRFDRAACVFLAAKATIFLLTMLLIESRTETRMLSLIVDAVNRIPVSIDWGIPATLSGSLGLVLAIYVSWSQMNERWLIPRFGNTIENLSFEQQDRTIAREATEFRVHYPCLVRKHLLFGMGDIEIYSAVNHRLLERIPGVLFAERIATVIRNRLSVTDVAIAGAPASDRPSTRHSPDRPSGTNTSPKPPTTDTGDDELLAMISE